MDKKIPREVRVDPKTGRDPVTTEEFAAQNERMARHLEHQAAEDAARRFENGEGR